MTPSPAPMPDRVALLERLQDQQSALNDLTRQALATLNDTLRTQQRTLDRHSQALDVLVQRTLQHDEVLDHFTRAVDRLDVTLLAIKDLLNRPPNGH